MGDAVAEEVDSGRMQYTTPSSACWHTRPDWHGRSVVLGHETYLCEILESVCRSDSGSGSDDETK